MNIPLWDYRHPVMQVVYAYIAAYREKYHDKPNVPALQYAINSSLQRINEMGYTVVADGTDIPVQQVSIEVSEDDGKQVVNIQFNEYR